MRRLVMPGAWAIEPRTKQALEAAALRLITNGGWEALPQLAQRGTDDARRGYSLRGDIALIPLTGILTPYPTFMGQLFGEETTHDQLRAALDSSLEDSAVRSRVIIADSPGGDVAGLQRLADDVAAQDRAKPIYVYTESMLASAAFFIGAQARRIYVSPEGMVGSIGTLWVMWDMSELFKTAGVEVVAVGSGPNKGLGWEGTEISAGQRATVQESVNQLATVFKQAVMRGRGMTAAEVEAQADGWIQIGAAAVRSGLADRVATLNEVLVELGDRTVMPGRAGARGHGRRVEAQAMTFKQWCVARGLDPDHLDKNMRAELIKEWRAEMAAQPGGTEPAEDAPPAIDDETADAAEPSGGDDAGESETAGGTDQPPPGSPPPTDQTTDIRAAVRAEVASARTAEQTRITGIRNHAQRLTNLGLTIEPAVVDRAILDGCTASQANERFMNAAQLAQQRAGRSPSAGGAFAIHVAPEINRLALAGAVARSVNRTLVDPLATPQERREQEQAMDIAARLGSPGPLAICEHVLRMRGLPSQHGDKKRVVRDAIGTGDLTYIFSNIIGAELIGAYAEAPDFTVPLARVSDVPNFQEVERTEAGILGDLELLPRDEAAKHVSQSDKAETLKIARYAAQRWCDERDIIDDRFGVLIDSPAGLARAAARLRPNLFCAILMSNPTMADGYAVFSTQHNNYNTTGSVFGKTSVETLQRALNEQTLDDAVLAIQARHVLLPTTLTITAIQLLKSPEVRNVDAGAEYGTTNPLPSLDLNIIPEPRLRLGVTHPATKAAVSGSDTAWWMFASPAEAPVIEIAYLRGTNRRPTMSTWVKNGEEGRYGIGFSVSLDIGGAVIGYRGAQMATGAGG